MAEMTAPAPSRADEAAATQETAVPETTEVAATSLPSTTEAAESAPAPAEAATAAPATSAEEPAAEELSPKKKGKAKAVSPDSEGASADASAAPESAATGAAAATATTGSGEAVEEASSSAGGVLETPRPPPAAVLGQDDEIAPVAATSNAVVCTITLLLPTGRRKTYKIDDKFLSKRNVEVPETTEGGLKDPFSISIYKLKELILREWREEWDVRPASPTSIRLIHLGKLLDDKEQLKKYRLSADSPNVVHMMVKPPEMMEEEEAAKGRNSGQGPRQRDGSSNCCVIL